MVHIAEATVGRRYAGWFIRNTETAQRVLDALRATPLPIPSAPATAVSATAGGTHAKAAQPKSAWGTAKKVEIAA